MMAKKLITFTLALAVCVGSVFAEISIGGGADMVVVPLQVVTRDTAEDEGNIWVGAGVGRNAAMAGIRTRLNISGNFNDTIGFSTDAWFLFSNEGGNVWDGANSNAMEVRLGDVGNLWWRPLDWFRLDVGRVFNPSQAWRIAPHDLTFWTVGMPGGVFSPLSSGDIGAMGSFTVPQVQGLSIYALVPFFGMPFNRPSYDFPWLPGSLLTPGADDLHGLGDDDINQHRLLRVLQRSWLTVGYQTDLFHARLQFAGANPSGSINWTTGEDDEDQVATNFYKLRMSMYAPRAEAAFAWLGTSGLVVDLGVRVWLPISDWLTDTRTDDLDNPSYIRLANTGTYWGGLGFGLGASFAITNDFSINFRFDGDMLRNWVWTSNYWPNPQMGITSVTNPMRLSFHLWPVYTLPNGMRLTLAAGLNYVGRNTVERNGTDLNEDCLEWERSNRLRFGGGMSLTIPFGAASSLSVGAAYSHGTADIRGGEARVITVPISFSYNF